MLLNLIVDMEKLENSLAGVWNFKHSDEQKILWSLTRSTPIFIYSAISFNFVTIIYGYKKLSEFLGVHLNTAKRIVKSCSIYANKYIISLVELNEAAIKEKNS